MSKICFAGQILLAVSFPSLTYAQFCKDMGSVGGFNTGPNVEFPLQQNKIGNQTDNILFKCDNEAPLRWYRERSGPYVDEFQTNLDRLIDNLVPTRKQFMITVIVTDLGLTSTGQGRVIGSSSFNFAGEPFLANSNGPDTMILEANHYYMAVIRANADLRSNRTTQYSMNYGQRRPILDVGDLKITYAVQYMADETIKPCVPIYRFGSMNFKEQFTSTGPDFFEGGGIRSLDFNVEAYRNPDLLCDNYVATPLLTMETPRSKIGSIRTSFDNTVQLTNGTSLTLYQSDKDGSEKPLILNTTSAMDDIGPVYSSNVATQKQLTSSKKIIVKWGKTSGEIIKEGAWNVVLPFEIKIP